MLDNYFEGIPHEVVGTYHGRVAVQRVALEEEQAYNVDVAIPATGYLRVEMGTDGDCADEMDWEARTTIHDPDDLESLGLELIQAAEWVREREAADA